MAGNGAAISVELRIAEAPRSDVGLGHARIDQATRRRLGVERDDVIEIAGGRRTLAVVRDLGTDDEGKGIVRIDGLMRENARVGVGDRVILRKVHPSPAKEIELAAVIPDQHRFSFGENVGSFVKGGILRRPLSKGDTVIVPGIATRSGALPFRVTNTRPGGYVQVDEETAVAIRREPFRTRELLSPEDLVQAFVDRVADGLSASLEDFEAELGILSGETGEHARRLSSKVRDLLQDLRQNRNR